MMRRLSLAIAYGILYVAMPVSAAAQAVSFPTDSPCAHNAVALEHAFNDALRGTYVQARRVITAEDKVDSGCHVVFEMSDGSRIGGVFATRDITYSRWTPDDDHAPHDYELVVARQQLVLNLAELDPRNYQTPPPPPPSTERGAPVVMRPVKFDAADICSTIIKGRDSSTWFDAMQVQVARIKADIQDAYSALAETDQRLGTPGLTQRQLKTNQTIRKAQEERINFNNQLENFISVRCPAYFQEHRFDGR